MYVALTDDEKRLSELARQAERGEDVVLLRSGQAVARITAVKTPMTLKLKPIPSMEERRRAIEEIQASASLKADSGPSYDEIIEDMYDDDGLPK